jgi:hypothetical protein
VFKSFRSATGNRRSTTKLLTRDEALAANFAKLPESIGPKAK